MGNIATIQDVKYQQTLNVWCLRVANRHNSGLSVKGWCHNNMDKLKVWSKCQVERILPQSQYGKALTYLKNQWAYLVRFLEDGRLQASNNLAERSIKPFVMGRKTWLFNDSPRGAEASAVIFSIVPISRNLSWPDSIA